MSGEENTLKAQSVNELEKSNLLLLKEMSNINAQISEIRKDIQTAVTPKFLDLSLKLKDIIELSVDVWRMENRLDKVLSNLPENQKENLENSIQKIKRYLEKNDIETIDYTNKKFNDGLTIDILAVEKDSTIPESIVKETKEPTVMYKGQVVKRGKVVVLEKSSNDGAVTKWATKLLQLELT